jgi:hypothetical protein
MSNPKRPRNARRQVDRAQAAIAHNKDRIARLEPGGSPDWPIAVVSAVLVERRAAEIPCIQCGSTLDVQNHQAKTFGDVRRRVVHAKCMQCSQARDIWFVIAEPIEN